MALKNSNSQAEILEVSRIALQNVQTNPIIKPLMEEMGYNTAKIDEGKNLLELAKEQFNTHQIIEDAKAKAYQEFEDLRLEIEAKYAKDRKKAKIVFRKEILTFKELGLKGILPKSYVKWLETVNKFYNLINTDATLLTKLETLQVTQQHVTEIISQINNLENLRANYIQSKGNMQNATKVKNAAFKSLEEWISEFYAVARIALEEEPQLLESLGKQVKS
ncbi:hypothetical protein MC378_08120 [Polaribacter sp. MSW13]|uniref:Uncharacterized protein n=1 Tax=Polaribacter marinus TaxID=2916838 RepID=A0A9X1VMA5_9FLAO|nr:hypothetical protein [Polaribacter marinus]MCI2229129.1 hypothetical protein [Polaribacter marinus]